HSLVRDDPADDQFLPVREPPDVSQIDLHTVFEDGFGHPDWRKVFEDVKRAFPIASDRQAVWHEIAKRWLQELKENLGGTYRCYESDHFFLLAAEGKGPSRTLLSYLENSLAAIRRLIEPLMVRFYRKSIVLAFSEQDDYYAYISHFHQEGEHIQTSGIFV